ncbi:MAG: T9SS type A sorting domain-containing protein [Armatimonadetes bacterium]|nr:T9SS type A sorting domain-containing protein [Armatimonadota bacterium]
MKKSILFLVFFIFTLSLFSQVPNYEFIVEPIELMETKYDYMPANYNSFPIRVQPEISTPYGLPAGGVYIVFQAQETYTTERRVYYAYIDEDGNVTATDPVSMNDVEQGFPSLDLDPITCNPFVAWHAKVEPDNSYDVLSSYDLYHMMGSPGLWIDEFIVIDNPEAGLPLTGNDDDEFIWPNVFIDSSPLGGDYRRVYVYASNYTPTASGEFIENVILAYADFQTSDFDNQSTLDWSYRTIELFNNWHAGIPEYIKPYKAMTVQENKVVFMGYNSNNEIFALKNENYGEGEFTCYSQPWLFPLDNPQNLNGSYLYEDDSGNPLNIRQQILHSKNMNVVFTDCDSEVSFLGAMGITIDDEAGYFDLDWNQIYPKIFSFDLYTNEFSFYDLYIKGANPSDDNPMVPWDLNEDGLVDSFDANGMVTWAQSYPYIHFDENLIDVYTNFKITKSISSAWESWHLVVWQDCLKAKLASQYVPGYEEWLDVPEIAICAYSGFLSWSDPIFLNSNETPELAGMIPSFVYPGDKIEFFDYYHGKLHLFFLDENYYGPNGYYPWPMDGGILQYAALDIDFYFVSTEEEEVPQQQITMYNYPNPFNPTTTIQFSNEQNQQNEQIELEIYNIKGQEIKALTVTLSGVEGSVVWNGTDKNNLPVGSGIYFYKLNLENSPIRKMILLK